MTEYLELLGALENIAAGDMDRASMIHTAKVALGEATDEDDEDSVRSAKHEGIESIKCPMCHGKDEFCTLCNGRFVVSVDQHDEFIKQNPEAL